MKRLVSVCLLMLCLSSPVLCGHTVAGGFYCECDDSSHAVLMLPEDEAQVEQNQAPVSEVSELDAFLDVLLMMLSF